MHGLKTSVFCLLVCVFILSASSASAVTVFSADFESGTTAADIGSFSYDPIFTETTLQLVAVDGTSSATDWGTTGLWMDRSASSGGAAGFTTALNLTEVVEIDGATIDFDFILRRTNTANVKSHFITAFDADNNTVFSIKLIDREDSGLFNIEPEYTEPTETNERQRQTVAYVDPTNGDSLFMAADLASGVVPDSNDRSGGSNSFTFFFGNDNRDATAVNQGQAGSFSIATTAAGWSLNAKPRSDSPTLTEFTTNVLPFFTPGVTEIARVEVSGESVQAGGYWDNFLVTGNALPPLADIFWAVDADDNWNTAGNWNPVGVPNSNTAKVGFADATASSERTINLNVPATVNSLLFTSGTPYTISGANTLTLAANGGDDPEINTTAGTHTISAVIAGSDGLIKKGSGTLVLSANNTYSGVTDIQRGTLAISNTDSIPGDISISSNGTLEFIAGANGTISGSISGDGTIGDSNTQTTEVVTLTGDNSGFDGTIRIDGNLTTTQNAIRAGADNAFGSANAVVDVSGGLVSVEISGGATLPNTWTIGSRAGNNNPGAENTPHINSVAGSNTITGDISASGESNHNIGSDAGSTLTINSIMSDTNENGIFKFLGDGNIVIGDSPGAGRIVGTDVQVVKQGTGTLTIGTATSSTDTTNATGFYWGGPTTIEEGTLAVIAGAANVGELFSDVAVQSGATFDVSSFGSYNLQVGKGIGGSGTIDGNGSTTLGYFDDGFLTPGDSVGTLAIDGNLQLATFNDTPTGTINFELGSTTTIGSSANDLIDVSGTMTLVQGAGTNTFNLNVTPVDGGLATGSYRLIDAASTSGSVAGSAFVVQLVDEQGNEITSTRQALAVDTSTSGQLNLNVTGAAGNQNWTGTSSSAWDVGTSTNWSGADSLFMNLDNVIFDDSATTRNVSVDEAVAPASMTFVNTSGNDYTLTGDAGIIGTGGLSITAGGTVILANAGNSFSGNISVGTGSLELGDGTTSNNVLGATNNVSISAGGRLRMNKGVGNQTINGVVSGQGDVVVTSGTLTLEAANTYSGATTIDGGRLTITNPGALGTSTVTVNGGQLQANGINDTLTKPVTLNGGSLGVGGQATTVWSGAINLTADSNLSADGSSTLEISSPITGPHSITKTNAGTVQFSAANTYSGNTSVSDGTLALTGAASISSSPEIGVQTNGNFDVSGTTSGGYTLAANQTLAGDGRVTGNVTAPSGTTVRVGGTGFVGVDRLVGHWKFDVDGTDSASVPNDASFGASTSISSTAEVGAGSASFDDASDDNGNRITVDGFAGVTGNGARTYSFWFNGANSQENNATIVGAGTNAAGQRFDIKVAGSDMLRVEIQGNGVNYPSTDGGAFLDNSWHHIAVTLPDGGTLDDVVFYLDGSPLADDGTSNGSIINTANNSLFFGDSHNGASDRNFQGLLDDVQLYNIELNSGQVSSLFGTPGSTIDGLPQLFSPESLTINGDLDLDTGSTLEIDLRSETVFDTLDVTGLFDAGGTLEVSIDGSLVPSEGDSWDILDFGSVTGVFDDLMLPGLSAGLQWNTSNLLVNGTLLVEAIGAGVTGDYNGNGVVDSADYAVWLSQIGAMGAGLAADGNNDMVVDLSDYNVWRMNFGNSGTGSGSTGVPEPNSVFLLLGSLAAVLFFKRKPRTS